MPRFVVLKHVTPPGYRRPTHFDLLLEAGESCRTWALANEPREGEAIAAEALADHRLHYLEYEGEISGGRGSVVRYAAGDFEWIVDGPDEVRVAVASERFSGEIILKRLNDRDQWQSRFIRSS